MPFPLRIVSIEEQVFDGEAGFLLVTGVDGELGILAGHAPLLATLAPGPLVIKDEVGGPDREVLFVGGGFLEVLPDRVTILADVAERADDINEEHAEEARHRAQERLQGDVSAEEKLQMTQALEMAEARLRLARIRRNR